MGPTRSDPVTLQRKDRHMAKWRVADSVEMMIMSSNAIAEVLAGARDAWSRLDPTMARLIEGLRIQFAAFAAAATSGLIADLGTLDTIGAIYSDAAISICELTDTGEARAARNTIAKVSGMTLCICDLIEKGPRSVIRSSGGVC